MGSVKENTEGVEEGTANDSETKRYTPALSLINSFLQVGSFIEM